MSSTFANNGGISGSGGLDQTTLGVIFAVVCFLIGVFVVILTSLLYRRCREQPNREDASVEMPPKNTAKSDPQHSVALGTPSPSNRSASAQYTSLPPEADVSGDAVLPSVGHPTPPSVTAEKATDRNASVVPASRNSSPSSQYAAVAAVAAPHITRTYRRLKCLESEDND